MIKTSNDLMEWLDLKVGDRIRINDKPDNYIVELNEYGIPCVKDEYTKIRFEMTYLINRKVEIIPTPKRIGDLTCDDFNNVCDKCPLSGITHPIGCGHTLYSVLATWYKFAPNQQEIYSMLKAKLDKEVKKQ